MLISSEWINSFLTRDIKLTEMIDALDRAGVEVEEIFQKPKYHNKLVVGHILNVRKHPNADKLKVADVDVGKNDSLTIVCGASNLKEGQKVAVALVGAILPDGVKIKETDIRGQTSEGMICSARELSLGKDHDGILVLDPHIKQGSKINNVVESTTLIDITTATNRPDLQSVVGVAREVSAHTGAGMKDHHDSKSLSNTSELFKVAKNSKTKRFSATVYKVKNPMGQSPVWMRQRLIHSGIQPLGLVVDITNYVMLEYGQPLHAYDYNKLKGKITVRRSKKGESLITLDEKKRQLTAQDVVIADKNGPIAIAGVMGGKDTEVNKSTTRIVLESGSFDASSTRKSAQRHKVRTEASSRFEKDLPVEFVSLGVKRAAELLEELCVAQEEEQQAKTYVDSHREIINIDPDYVSKVSGIEVSPKQAVRSLSSLGFGVKIDSDGINVWPPYWRPDVDAKEDVFEEVIKMVGLDKIPSRLPSYQPDLKPKKGIVRMKVINELRHILSGMGITEIVTYPFISEEQAKHELEAKTKDLLRVKNPRSLDQAYLRSSLMPSHLTVLKNNDTITDQIKLFELSNVFKGDQERYSLGLLASLPTNSYQITKGVLDQIFKHFNIELGYQDSTIDSLHPTNQIKLQSGSSQELGFIGEVHPMIMRDLKLDRNAVYVELDLDTLLNLANHPSYTPYSRQQSSSRDVTIEVNTDVYWLDIKSAIDSLNLADASFAYDYYGDEDRDNKSVTIHLEFSEMGKTLKSNEINSRMSKIIDKLKKEFSAKIK